MARFFIRKENIHDADATIAGQEFEHLRRVLRLTVGDSVTLFDDTGWEYEAVIRSLHADRGELAIRRSYQAEQGFAAGADFGAGAHQGRKDGFCRREGDRAWRGFDPAFYLEFCRAQARR